MAGQMRDFIYSIYINKVDASATAFKLKFGVNNDSFWLLKVDVDNKVVSFGNNEKENIKTASYNFKTNREYKIDLVVNDELAKVFIDEEEAATLTFNVQGYVGGEVIDNLNEATLTTSSKSIISLNTSTGDFFCGGYDVLKVINLSDGNYKLDATEYTVSSGTISISEAYLNTLENSFTYEFRAVTSLTDLDFYVTTKEVGAQVTTVVEKYYRGDDARFELNQNTNVKKAVIEEREFEFTQNDTIITINSESLKALTSGEHTIKFFTENGRPETKFSLYEKVETLPEIPTPVNHSYFFIDISIFAVLILGYVLFSQIKKRGNKGV